MIGHWFGGEALGTRTLVGAALILASVVAIISARGSGKPASQRVESAVGSKAS